MRSAIVAALSAAAVAKAAVIDHYWNISYAEANPDGLQQRRVIGVNGTWPPPPLVGSRGDVFVVHAYNGLEGFAYGTSLHTHGMMFNNSNWYDGAVSTTQCAIPFGETLDYYIDTTLNTGTYWIHGHHMGQYVDGLRAPVIIHDNVTRSDNVTWDDEYLIVVSDWYHDEWPVLIDEFMNWKNPTGAEPVPNAAAIYVLHNGTYYPSAEAIADGSAVNDNATMTFEAGKTYRVRIVNQAALAMFYIQFQQHDMYVIEMDGVETAPYKIDTLTAAVAQRYSLLIQAKNETSTNYGVDIMQSPDMYDTVPDDLVLNNTIQIVYAEANAPAESNSTNVVEIIAYNDTELVPLEVKPAVLPTIEFELNVYFDTYDDGTNRASFNNITYSEPNVASMFTALTMPGNDSFLPAVYGAQTNAIVYEHMAMVQLTVYNWDAGFHPFHLHGHEFQVIEKSFDVTSNDTVVNPPTQEGQENPARRDTITIPPTGKVVLRWRADNPGAWMFHCHIDWHLSAGLAVIMIEAPEKFQELNTTIPDQIYDQCKAWDRPTSGNVVGTYSTTDFKGQPWGPFPLQMGWTPKAIGALAGCIITFLVGLATIIWYGWGSLDEEDMEEEVKRAVDRKQAAKANGWRARVLRR